MTKVDIHEFLAIAKLEAFKFKSNLTNLTSFRSIYLGPQTWNMDIGPSELPAIIQQACAHRRLSYSTDMDRTLYHTDSLACALCA